MKKFLLLFLIILVDTSAFSQKKFTTDGYVKYLGMYYKPTTPVSVNTTDSLNYLFLNNIHNRLNFRWYATNEITFALEARNRLYFGQMVRKFPNYKEMIDQDNGYFNLGTIIASGDNWFLHSAIDRAYIDYTKEKWQFRVGRQRINWGVNLVWNPNDIFNTFSYFDFDYEERPGIDGVKIQYYTGVTSSAELVYKVGRNNDESAVAGMYRFSKFNYDFQTLGGWVGKDFVLGGGWAGDIKGGGFRGEFSYFIPREKDNGSEEAFVASVSGDYTMKNSLYLHTGILFNSNGATGKAGSTRGVFDQNLTAKMLSMGMFNLFGQISYPFTPLLSGDFSTIINPCDGSSYLGPSVTCSLTNNLELMVTGQLFLGQSETEYGDYGRFFYGRVKWSF